MSKVEIEVTQEDIDKAIVFRKENAMMSIHCPIATAMSRVLSYSVSIDGTNWRFVASPQYSMLPPEAVEFIGEFDSFNPVYPITLTIEV